MLSSSFLSLEFSTPFERSYFCPPTDPGSVKEALKSLHSFGSETILGNVRLTYRRIAHYKQPDGSDRLAEESIERLYKEATVEKVIDLFNSASPRKDSAYPVDTIKDLWDKFEDSGDSSDLSSEESDILLPD